MAKSDYIPTFIEYVGQIPGGYVEFGEIWLALTHSYYILTCCISNSNSLKFFSPVAIFEDSSQFRWKCITDFLYSNGSWF